MKNPAIISFLILFLCFYLITASSQKLFTNPVIYTINEENGLSDNHSTCILKDNDNLVWIGTSDGLDMMNGSVIKIYKHNASNPNSICDNSINCLALDEQSNVWIGTRSGLCCYNRVTQQFNRFPIPPSIYGKSDFIKSILISHSSHHIWCATDGGLYLFHPDQKKFIAIINDAARLDSRDRHCNKINSLAEDHNGLLWICTADGLWSFNPSTHQFRHEISEKNDKHYNELFLAVLEDHQHRIWTSSWNQGLKEYDPITGKVTCFRPGGSENKSYSAITEFQQDDGTYQLWLSGNFLGFDPQRKLFFHFQKPFQYSGYPDVNPSFCSADKWLWMTTGARGVFVYNTGMHFFSHFLFKSSYTDQLVVFKKWQNRLIAGGNASHLLTVYDSMLNIVKSFSIPLPDTSTEILNIEKESENNWWLSTTSGILHLHPDDNRTQWFRHTDNDRNSLPLNFITRTFFDAEKKLWIFPWRKGIWQMDTLTGTCRLLCKGFLKEGEHIKPLVIGDAVEDNEHNIWMGDFDEGIILFNHNTGQFSKPFTKELGERNTLIRLFYKNGFCYSFSPDEIVKWDPHTHRFWSFSLPEEMDKTIYDMTPDNKGNWWLATKNGLVLFNEPGNLFKLYSVTDGLLYNDMNGNLFCLNDSCMVFGTQGYFTLFDPRALLEQQPKKENSLITEITVNGNIIAKKGEQPIRLRYNKNNLFFKWALPDYTSPFKNQYYCKLLSIDNAWRYAGHKGEVQYANLSPGSYTIELKAENSNGISTAENAVIHFVIEPPLWKRNWFILLLSLVFILVFIVVVRYISQRNLKEKLLLLEKEQAVEKERNRISRDMHDDLGSGLTKIAILSEVTKKQLHEPERAKEQLETISASSRELVDNLQDIIWVLNPKNDTLGSLIAYIREYGLKFFEPSETMIQFIYPEIPDDIKLSEEKRRNIFLVVKESFNNIAKHAWCNKVSFSVFAEKGELRIIIQDDGKGFDMATTRLFSNGLTNMKTRMRQVAGSFQITSSPGKGTCTTIAVPV